MIRVKNLTLLLSILIFSITTLPLKGQIVKGVVNIQNANGSKEPLPFASVYWLERNRVFTTAEDGTFSFDREKEDKVSLVAAFIGYEQDTLVLQNGDGVAHFTIREGMELEAARVVNRQSGNYISKITPVRTEVITAAGLCKMACCNLAESFENSASVTVGYADAITGARQIRLLGLSGIYTQMLDENRPVMRGIASPFGLSYVPGQWLESIQIAKGPASVINGIEAISGQINLEHRKPTTEQPLFFNLFLSDVLRNEANIASSLQLNDKWSTVTLAHYSYDPLEQDGNGDGFKDEPNGLQLNLSNRWLYMAENNLQIRFGFKAFTDDRVAGQMGYTKDTPLSTSIWGSRIKNSGINGYFKIGVPLNADNSQNIAAVADYSYYKMDSHFGLKLYDATQSSFFLNLIYQNEVNEEHKYSLGASYHDDNINEHLQDWYQGAYAASLYPGRYESAASLFGEYTFSKEDKISLVAGIRGDYNNLYGWLFTPRVNLKYSFSSHLVFRALAGRGYRSANLITDNLGILSTARKIEPWAALKVEDAWTYGANLTTYFHLGEEEASLSFDYFRTDFNNQVIVDQELDLNKISVYNSDGPSYTNTYQVDFNMEPVERLTLMATFRYTDSKVTLQGQGLVEKPLVSRYKGVFNVQYATRMNIWTFDATAQLNGPARIPQFAGFGEYSPVYPIFFAQVTKKFKNVELYGGVENIGDYRQTDAIVGAANPYDDDFNASIIWGPLMGRRFYIGLRYTLWK